MLICTRCGKGKNILAYSRHKKGSSGAGGVWALRAPIHQRTQKPNLHVYKRSMKIKLSSGAFKLVYKGQKYCTSCLRIVKVNYQKIETPQPTTA